MNKILRINYRKLYNKLITIEIYVDEWCKNLWEGIYRITEMLERDILYFMELKGDLTDRQISIEECSLSSSEKE